jgi:septal ring factor EnvC (AmiA/AmiB activator)
VRKLRAQLTLGAVLGAGAAAFSAFAADPPRQQLEQIERSIGTERETQRRLTREAETLARELGGLRTRSVRLAEALQVSEENLSDLEQRLSELDADARAKEADFAQRRVQLGRMVAELGRLGRQPVEAALVLPASPMDSARTAKLLGTLTPALRDQANALSVQLVALQVARASVDAQHKAVAQAAERLAADREALDSVIERRARIYAELEIAQRGSAARLERLTRDAQDIRELIERLNADRLAAEAREQEAAQSAAREAQLAGRAPPPPERPGRPFSEAGAAVSPPARGRVVLSFGQPGEGGQPHRGLTIETRSGAQIVAPYDGQIAFAGPFRTYGLILIIEHSEGYHTLLAGLGRIDGAVGQRVTTGEPVGTAGSPEAGSPSIYVELRRNGQPINPLPWLAPRNEKVSG